MKQKSEVFEKFKQWLALVDTQTGRKLKVLRSDNMENSKVVSSSPFAKKRGSIDTSLLYMIHNRME